MKLTELEVEQAMACRKVIDEPVSWRTKDHPDWARSDLKVFHDNPGEMKITLSVSKDGRKVTFAVIYRGARVKALDIRGGHINPGPDRTRFVRQTHKHTYTDQYGDSWAYLPTDITTDAPEGAFREFCSECNIEFKGKWNAPPFDAELDL